MIRKIWKIFKYLRVDGGSAVVEFIALGLPLFLPLSLFLTSVHHDASIQSQTRNFARQVARVYVTSPSLESSIQRVNLLKSVFELEVLSKVDAKLESRISISCSSTPCLLPGSNVLADIQIISEANAVVAQYCAREVVDQWRAS